MFTGIIESVGSISSAQRTPAGDLLLHIHVGQMSMADVQLGDSIAVNGVCLTVVKFDAQSFWADVSNETVAHSGFAYISSGQKVNLEKAMAMGDRFGGHIVTGHVDALATVTTVQADARSWRIDLQVPAELDKYLASKGSITVDGVSLTANHVANQIVSLNVVPHTAQETIIMNYRVGDQVHIEVDVIARYLEKLMLGQQQEKASMLSSDFLAKHGYWK